MTPKLGKKGRFSKVSPVNLSTSSVLDEGYKIKLKRLMLFRVIFALLLLGSTFIVHLKELLSLPGSPLVLFYGLAAFIFLCSLIYIVAYHRMKNHIRLAYIQIGLDTFIITILIYLSGGFASFYSFLYPVVPVYSSVLLFRQDTLIISGLASVQYVILIGLEYFKIIPPVIPDWAHSAASYHWSFVTYKTILVIVACFAVSLLSNYLVEQARKAKKELKAMRDHVSRVDKMASLGEMAAGLAHEIKNPLASMTGSIQILRQESFGDPDQDKLMEIVTREANRLSDLVSNFLLFAKTPGGQLQPVSLTKEIEETLVLLEKDGAHYDDVDIIKDLKPNLWVEMDPVHLRQILWNLLLNADQAVGEDGRVIIRTFLKDDRITVEIVDNGIGIEKDNLERIFLPFYSNKPRGTGLGLSIVHNLLEGYNSRLDIQSTPGQGTTVTFSLKCVQPPR